MLDVPPDAKATGPDDHALPPASQQAKPRRRTATVQAAADRQTGSTKALPSPLMTQQQVAAYLNISPRSLDRYVAAGRIPCLRLGGTGPRRFRLDAVERFLEPESDPVSTDTDVASFIAQQ